MENQEFTLEFHNITASDTDTFNAYMDAIRCGSFIKFVKFYPENLPALFKKIIYFKSKINPEDEASIYAPNNDEKGKLLSIAYKDLTMVQLKEVYEKVIEQRDTIFKPILTEKHVEFKDLSDLDKIKYSLLFGFGEKIGGYAVIASLDIQELITLHKYFFELQKEKNDIIENAQNKGK